MASSYDAIGVARRLPDGLVPEALVPIELSFDNMRASGGRVTGLVARSGSADAIELTGDFDSSSGDIVFTPGARATFFGGAHTLEQLGGRADEGRPTDGIADELVGFVGTSTGAARVQGRFIATARVDGRPQPPDFSKITAMVADLGEVTISGGPETAPPLSGIEIFRHTLAKEEPDFRQEPVAEDGSFSVTITALPEDMLIIRRRMTGRASDAGFVMIMP